MVEMKNIFCTQKVDHELDEGRMISARGTLVIFPADFEPSFIKPVLHGLLYTSIGSSSDTLEQNSIGIGGRNNFL